MLSTRIRRAFVVLVLVLLIASLAVAVAGRGPSADPTAGGAELGASSTTSATPTTMPAVTTTTTTPLPTTGALPSTDASVTLTKVGPPLEFGFRMSCSNGRTVSLGLAGGDFITETFDVDRSVSCIILEEALDGWTTTATVAGANAWRADVATGYPSVEFTFGAGAQVEVTFTNEAGYLSEPPTGSPPPADPA